MGLRVRAHKKSLCRDHQQCSRCTSPSTSAPHPQTSPLSRKPPVAPLPLTAFRPCSPSAWLPAPQMLRVRHSPFLARITPRPWGGLSTFRCSHNVELRARSRAGAEDWLPRKPGSQGPPAHLPQEGRPRCHSASGTLPWLPGWPQKSQRWPLAWQVNKHGDLVHSPTPIPQVPAAPSLLGGSSFLRVGGGGNPRPQKSSTACCALQLSLPTARDARGP